MKVSKNEEFFKNIFSITLKVCFAVLLFLLISNNVYSQDGEYNWEFNCPDKTCENPESFSVAIFFPIDGTAPCPDCDFKVYIRYDICPGPPRTIHLEVLGITDFDYWGDVNTCDLCDWRDLHDHAIRKLLQWFAQNQPDGTILHYREKSCWVKLGKIPGPVGGYPPGLLPIAPSHAFASAPCPGECCKYIFETNSDGMGSWGIHFVNEYLQQNIECPVKDQFGPNNPPRNCEELCDPYAWWSEKGSFGDKTDNNFTMITFPNPASNYINFSIHGIESGSYTFNIYNVNGVKLFSFELKSDGTINHQMNVNDFANGYYNYELLKDGKLIQKLGFIVKK